MKKISFLTRFKDYGMTAQEYLDFCKNFIVHLRDFDERFKTIYSWGFTAKASKYIKDDLSDFDEVVFNQLDEGVAYINPDPNNKKLTLQSKCKIGFMHSFSNTHYDNNQKSVYISCGKINKPGLGVINFEHSKDLQNNLTLDELIIHLNFIINIVPIVYASIGYTRFIIDVNDTNRIAHDEEIDIGWITYTNRIETAEVLPDYVSYKKLPTGVIFWLSDTKIAADNMEYVEKAVEVRNILAKHDLLKYNQH